QIDDAGSSAGNSGKQSIARRVLGQKCHKGESTTGKQPQAPRNPHFYLQPIRRNQGHSTAAPQPGQVQPLKYSLTSLLHFLKATGSPASPQSPPSAKSPDTLH